MSRETDVALTLYSRKVMILQKANNILPKWLRFVKGLSCTVKPRLHSSQFNVLKSYMSLTKFQ